MNNSVGIGFVGLLTATKVVYKKKNLPNSNFLKNYRYVAYDGEDIHSHQLKPCQSPQVVLWISFELLCKFRYLYLKLQPVIVYAKSSIECFSVGGVG